MKKKVNNQQVNNQQVNGQQVNNGCQHVQLGGMAFYDESKCFLFAPNEHGAGEKVQGFRSQGVAQQLSDGTFDFVVKPRVRSQSVLIRKLARTIEQDQGWSYPAHPEGVLRRRNQYRQHACEGSRRGCGCFGRISVEAIKEVLLKVFDVQLNNSK